MARILTCPHCERSWDLDDERFTAHRADDIYADHLRLFCKGTPETPNGNVTLSSNASGRARKVESVSAA